MDSIVLDDGINYAIVEEENIKGIKYTLFAEINNPQNFCFRKTKIENGEEYFVGLDDEKEFELALMTFSKNIIK